ncbi:DUF1003 domain-containing protein [Arcanobacterium haemolyticum]|nr:DUF1003 domain-containing protein [Arcanobacterium haemolyticum]
MSDFDKPVERAPRRRRRPYRFDSDAAGRFAERIARFTGTATFLIYLTIFVVLWMGWNTFAPEHLRFDSAAIGFTALTLVLSLQASYSSPLILLAQNRQDDRDRVNAEQDRQRAERNLADTEYLAREIAGLRMALGEVATRDYVRSELRDALEAFDRDREERLAERDQRILELQAELDELRRGRENPDEEDDPS